jgi:hypothetical protein
MPEIECPQCGHRALSVATRCPRCGHEFPPNLIQPLPSTADRHWVRWSFMGAGALAIIIAIGKFGRYESAAGKPGGAPVAPARESVRTTADTIARDTVARPAPSAPRQPQKPPPQQRTQPPPPPPQTPAPSVPPTTGDLQQRYATVFVNVRRSRSPTATTVAVLKPGDAVLVDSLRRGWYRIVRDGRTLGYADRRFLATSPP